MNAEEATKALLDELAPLEAENQSSASDLSDVSTGYEATSSSESDPDMAEEVENSNVLCNSNVLWFFKFYPVSKSGEVRWKKGLMYSTRPHACNILKHTPGPTPFSRNKISTPLDAFNLIFDQEIFRTILYHTNDMLDMKKEPCISMNDLKKFIGLVILAGTMNSNMECIKWMWHEKYGRKIFPSTMSRRMFSRITANMRFDDFRSRRAAQSSDKLQPIRWIFERVIKNSQKLMKPSESVTIDEQLIPFRGRCSFKQYIPSKPAKYGIKVWCLNDSNNFYLYNAEIYCGKRNGVRETNQGENVVLRLLEGFYLQGMNLTCDNFFTTYSLTKKLMSKKMTLVGTVRKNRRELPPLTPMAAHQSEYYQSEGITLLKFAPKVNKLVVLLSSFHNEPFQVDANKPEIIEYYNKTKGGVDCMDMMLGNYTTKRISRRWPMVCFYNLIDIALLNSFIVFNEIFPQYFPKSSKPRRIFIDAVAISLIESCNEDENQSDGRQKRMKMNKGGSKGRCHICPRTLDRKQRTCCDNCQKYVCLDHSSIVCDNCIQN